MMKRVVTIIGLCLVCAMPALAGIHYKSRSHQEGKGASKQMDMTVEGWVDGDNAKILFTESKNDLMGKGSYLVTTDGGKILYLVDPKEKTYTEWDLNAMMNMLGTVMESMGGMIQMEFSDPEVEKLLEESGGTLLGLPTTHYRYRTAYDMEMKIMGMKRSQSFETLQDIWSTEDLADPALGVWLKRDPPSMGNVGIEKVIEAEMSKMKGFPLKTVQETITTGQKGKQQTTTTTTEVYELNQTTISPDTFEIPADYERREMDFSSVEGFENTNPYGDKKKKKKKD
jgi:hypothetical protein